MTNTARSITEKVNADALTSAQQRQQSTQNLITQLDHRLAGSHFADGDIRKLETLRSDLAKAETATREEIDARQDLATAYANSEFAAKEADPEVKSKQKDLAQIRKETKPVMHGKQNMVNSVCQPCLSKEIDSLVDCDTPIYVKYHASGGPKYKDCHDHTLAGFKGWDDLIKANVKTSSEKNVLVAMSANEGDLDSVQAYDSEIVSMGAMQKTVDKCGTGELPRQLAQFRDDPATAAVFQRELGAKGYSIAPEILGMKKDGTSRTGPKNALYFTDPNDQHSQPITGAALDQFIQSNKERWADTIGPFRALGRTPEFQRKQVLDFNNRLVSSLGKVPTGYKHPIGEYLTSEMGAALVLDQDVNRPNFVETDFRSALKEFYADHPGAAQDPSTWSNANRIEYEESIIENYAAVRRTTDSSARAAKLAQQNLSAVPGSLSFPQ